MMALDFPAAPTLNQKYPTPAVPGVPTYTWDGQKWTTKSDAIGGAEYVKKTGDFMTDSLTVINADVGFFAAKSPTGAHSAIFEGAVGTATDYSDYKTRWTLVLGEGTPETGGNTGSHFNINR